MKRKGMIIALGAAVLAVTALGMAATIWHQATALPDPATADRDGLFRWLVVRDLAEEPEAVRSTLIRRLEEELDEGIEFSSVESELSEERKARLWENIDVLLAVWFRQKAETYHHASSADRGPMIDRLLDRVTGWKLLEAMQSADPASVSERSKYALLVEKTDEWIAESPAGERPHLRKFVAAVKQRLLARSLKNLFGGFRAAS